MIRIQTGRIFVDGRVGDQSFGHGHVDVMIRLSFRLQHHNHKILLNLFDTIVHW